MAFDLTPSGIAYIPGGKFDQAINAGQASTTTTPIPAANNFSVSCWVYSGGGNGLRVFASQRSIFWIGLDDNVLKAEYGAAGATSLASSAVVGNSAWHHVKLTVTPAGGALSMDGIVVAQSNNATTSGSGDLTAYPFLLRGLAGLAQFDYLGVIDDVAVWSADPTGYNQPYTVPTAAVSNSASNLVAVYHLDGDTNNAAGTSTAATAITLSGPTGGASGVASTAFTVGANGAITGSIVVTPAATGGGTFSPTSVTISSGAPTATFTYTPASAGAKSISVTNNGGLTNPSAITYTATAGATVIPVDNAALYWSPRNWDTINVGTFGVATKSMQTACCGAYLKTRVTGTTQIALQIDTSIWSSLGGATPLLMWSIGGGPAQTAQPASGATTVPLATGLTTGTTYDVDVWLLGSVEAAGSRWGSAGVSPTNALRVTGLSVDAGATMSQHSMIQPKTMVFYADSIGEGVRAAGSTQQPGDHGRSAPWFVASGLGCELGNVGYGSLGWEAMGAGGVPELRQSFLYHSSGRARSIAGVDYVFVMLGFNGGESQGTIQSWIGEARAAAGANAWIFVVIAPSGDSASTHIAAVNAYKAANPADLKVALIDYRDVIPVDQYNGPVSTSTPSYGSIDKCHPLERANASIAAAIVGDVQAAMGGGGTVTVTQLVAVGVPL